MALERRPDLHGTGAVVSVGGSLLLLHPLWPHRAAPCSVCVRLTRVLTLHHAQRPGAPCDDGSSRRHGRDERGREQFGSLFPSSEPDVRDGLFFEGRFRAWRRSFGAGCFVWLARVAWPTRGRVVAVKSEWCRVSLPRAPHGRVARWPRGGRLAWYGLLHGSRWLRGATSYLVVGTPTVASCELILHRPQFVAPTHTPKLFIASASHARPRENHRHATGRAPAWATAHTGTQQGVQRRAGHIIHAHTQMHIYATCLTPPPRGRSRRSQAAPAPAPARRRPP